MESVEPTQANSPEKGLSNEKLTIINRFVSTLAGSFRAFYLYKQDNKAIDEITKNVKIRFEDAAKDSKTITIGVTHQSLTYNGDPIGFKEVTIYMATTLYGLGIKQVSFTSPLQGRHFFALLNILTSKESQEVKQERLAPFFADDEEKPIALIPMASSALALKISDELLQKKLSPLTKPEDQGGLDIINALGKSGVNNIPDLYTWICLKSLKLNENLKTFILNLVDTSREGYFPSDRFLNNLPLPGPLKNQLMEQATTKCGARTRKPTPLGHRFIPSGKNEEKAKLDVVANISTFTEEEAKLRKELVIEATKQSPLQDLELAQSLLSQTGPNFNMGLKLLLRILASENGVAIQEKALKLGIGLWTRFQSKMDDINLMSLLSSLRQQLSAIHNITLIFFPLRNLTIESEMFARISLFLISLGEPCLPSLVKALEAEEDRGMRRKLIHLITKVAKEGGDETLIESLKGAPNFLMRNIIMILGDLRSEKFLEKISELTSHSFKIIRVEAVRSLIKIGGEKSQFPLIRCLSESMDDDVKQAVINNFKTSKNEKNIDPLILAASHSGVSSLVKGSIYQALGSLGGPKAKQFLESQIKTSLLEKFNSEESKNQTLIKSLLAEMG